MDSPIVDRRIRCPFCAEPMSIVIDLSAGSQSYVEDCQICCQPMQISFETSNDELDFLQVDCAS
jgi:transcription elongation factor Elf1